MRFPLALQNAIFGKSRLDSRVKGNKIEKVEEMTGAAHRECFYRRNETEANG